MMYTSYYGMENNPFLKDESVKYPYESNDYKQTITRFNYLKEIKGIGLFTGAPGYGKTYTVRKFVDSLNTDIYKPIYISVSQKTNMFNFFKALSNALGLDVGACYSVDIFRNIQLEFKRLVERDKINPIIIIDDAHLLSREILQNFKVFYDFEMDSKDYVTLILIGNDILKEELKKSAYETLRQRIIVNYSFEGLSREEVKKYVKTRLEEAKTSEDIFTENSLNALYSCCKSNSRRLNTLIINSLLMGYQERKNIIDEEIIMLAKEEMDLE